MSMRSVFASNTKLSLSDTAVVRRGEETPNDKNDRGTWIPKHEEASPNDSIRESSHPTSYRLVQHIHKNALQGLFGSAHGGATDR